MSDIYCGAEVPPKGKKYGSYEECLRKKQVRRYGVIQKPDDDNAKKKLMLEKEIKKTRLRLNHYKNLLTKLKESAKQNKKIISESTDQKVIKKLSKMIEKYDERKSRYIKNRDEHFDKLESLKKELKNYD